MQLRYYGGVPLDQPIWVDARVPMTILFQFHRRNKLENHWNIPTGCVGGNGPLIAREKLVLRAIILPPIYAAKRKVRMAMCLQAWNYNTSRKRRSNQFGASGSFTPSGHLISMHSAAVLHMTFSVQKPRSARSLECAHPHAFWASQWGWAGGRSDDQVRTNTNVSHTLIVRKLADEELRRRRTHLLQRLANGR